MSYKPTPKGMNLKTKKAEEIKDAHLTKMHRKGGKIGYAVWGHGSGGITMFRIVGKDTYESYKKQGMPEKEYKKKAKK